MPPVRPINAPRCGPTIRSAAAAGAAAPPKVDDAGGSPDAARIMMADAQRLLKKERTRQAVITYELLDELHEQFPRDMHGPSLGCNGVHVKVGADNGKIGDKWKECWVERKCIVSGVWDGTELKMEAWFELASATTHERLPAGVAWETYDYDIPTHRSYKELLDRLKSMDRQLMS